MPSAASSRTAAHDRAAVLRGDRRPRGGAPAGRTGTRRSGRAGAGWSRRRARPGSRTRARTRPRAARAAPRCARPRGRRPGARRRRRSSRASRRGRGSRGRPRTRRAPAAVTKPAARRARRRGRSARRARTAASGSRTRAPCTAPAPRARRRRTGTPPARRRSGARFGRSWRSATIATHSRVSGSSRSSLTRGCGQHLGGEPVEPFDVERRAHREDQPFGAGVAVRADPVDHLLDAAGEHARPHVLGDLAELRLELLVAERDADVHRPGDLRRVADRVRRSAARARSTLRP